MSAEAPVYPLNEETRYIAHDIWHYLINVDEPKENRLVPADAIMVLGCTTNRVALTAFELYKNKFAPLLICTGGNSKKSDDWKIAGISEARLNKATLLDKGVPERDILFDDQATHFGENIRNSRAELLKRVDHPKKVIGVTIDFAVRRLYASLERQWVGIKPMVVPIGTEFEWYLGDEHRFGNFANNLVLELEKVITYPANDLMLQQKWDHPDFVQARASRARLMAVKNSKSAATH